MGVTDLGDAGGMAFVFDPPTNGVVLHVPDADAAVDRVVR